MEMTDARSHEQEVVCCNGISGNMCSDVPYGFTRLGAVRIANRDARM